MFGRCQSTSVTDFVSPCNLILLEEFKNCLPDKIISYVNEQNVSTVSDVAVLVLTHRDTFERPNLSEVEVADSFRASSDCLAPTPLVSPSHTVSTCSHSCSSSCFLSC